MTEPGFIAATSAAVSSTGDLARDVRGGDDNVGGGGLLGVELRGGLRLVGGHFLGVAVLGLLGLRLDGDELGAHRLDLLGGLGAQVSGLDDRAHGVRGADRGQASHARADDVDDGRRNLAGGGDLASEQATEGIGRLDDRAIAGDIGLGAEYVHGLCAGDARHGVHGHGGHVLVRKLLDELFVTTRCQASDKGGAGLKLCALLVSWRVEGGDDVRVPNIVSDDARTGLFIQVVRVIGLVACAGLDRDLVAKLDELAHGVRRG